MRINDLNRTPVTEGAEKTDQAAPKRALEKTPNATAASDQANVSQLAQALATQALATNDPQRLEQLRLDVQSGNYAVSADAVAKAIIDQHLKE